MIELIEQLALVIIGIIIGSILGTEYARWRMGIGDIVKKLFGFVGIDYKVFKKLPMEEKRKQIGAALATLFKDMFPQEAILPPVPSRITDSMKRQFFVPTCPKCGFAAAPILEVPGATVEAVCSKHGVFHVKIPPAEEKKE